MLAGSRAEGLRDGPAREAHLAQPSGLTAIAAGAIAWIVLWLTDSGIAAVAGAWKSASSTQWAS